MSLFNPLDPTLAVDLYPAYAKLRAQDLTTLLTEHPSVQVQEPGCVFRDTPLMRGLKALPIEW